MKSSFITKVAVLILAVALVFTVVQPAFAAEELPVGETVETTTAAMVTTETETTTEQETTTEEETTVPENPTQPEKPEEDEDTIVARASVFMAMYVFPVSAHSWIYVENLTDSPMMIGLYEVPPGQGVSVGTFSFSVRDGWGLYYNLEAYRENKKDRIDKCWAITVDMTRSQVEKLSSSIRNYPNFWDIFIFNCTFFTFSVWNANTNYFFIPFMIPAVPWFEIMIAGAKKGETPMYYPTEDQIFRQRGSGASAYLEPAGEKTIYH